MEKGKLNQIMTQGFIDKSLTIKHLDVELELDFSRLLRVVFIRWGTSQKKYIFRSKRKKQSQINIFKDNNNNKKNAFL